MLVVIVICYEKSVVTEGRLFNEYSVNVDTGEVKTLLNIHVFGV